MKAGEWMGIFLMIWKAGPTRFHWVLFFHYYIFRPFWTNLVDCITFRGVLYNWRKIILTIWYHLVPVCAYIVYDFWVSSDLRNFSGNATDNLDGVDFKGNYEHWDFGWVVLTSIPTACFGGASCVLAKYWTIKAEAQKMRYKERKESQMYLAC
jgi:hypothetical protein